MKVQVEGSQQELADNREAITQAIFDLIDDAEQGCQSALCKAGNSTHWGNHPKAAINDLRRIWVEGYTQLLDDMVVRLNQAIDEAAPEVPDNATIEALHLDLDRNPEGKG